MLDTFSQIILFLILFRETQSWHQIDTENNPNESIKISIRFLTNEIRSDALEIKIFNRKCSNSYLNCKFSELTGDLKFEIQKEILKKASLYKKQNAKDYKYPQMEDLTKN